MYDSILKHSARKNHDKIYGTTHVNCILILNIQCFIPFFSLLHIHPYWITWNVPTWHPLEDHMSAVTFQYIHSAEYSCVSKVTRHEVKVKHCWFSCRKLSTDWSIQNPRVITPVGKEVNMSVKLLLLFRELPLRVMFWWLMSVTFWISITLILIFSVSGRMVKMVDRPSVELNFIILHKSSLSEALKLSKSTTFRVKFSSVFCTLGSENQSKQILFKSSNSLQVKTCSSSSKTS